MLRILLLVLALGIVFFGFAAPFLFFGPVGLVVGAAAIATGAVAFWFVEQKTASRLDKDNVWNITMKAGGSQAGIFGSPDSDDRC